MDGHSALISDTLANLVTGLGTAKDRSQQGRFYRRPTLSRDEIVALYESNWLAGKLVDAPAEDACREWRAWNGTAANVAAVEQAEDDLNVRGHVVEAMKLAGRDGGAAIILGTGSDPAEPINPATLPRGGLRYLLTLSRYDLAVGDLDRDPVSPGFGRPLEYRMFTRGGVHVPIHPSRVVVFVGTPRLDTLVSGEPWGDSIYERLYDAVRDATAAYQGLAALMQEAKVDVVSIPGLTQNVGRADYRSAVISRFALAMAAKSINNTLILDAAETWQQKTLSFAGYPDALDRLLLAISGAADMPLTRLLGRSPAGLNATGEADLEQWYEHIHALQATRLGPALRPLDRALIRSATGRDPRNLTYTWRPLYKLGADEKAQIADRQSQALERIARTGLLDRRSLAQALVSQLDEDGFLPGVQPASDLDTTGLPPAAAPTNNVENGGDPG